MDFSTIIPYLQKIDVFWSIIIVLIFLALAKIFESVIHRTALKVAKRTKGTLDDRLIESLKKPVFFGLILLGLYIGLMNASIFEPYFENIRKSGSIVGILWLAYAASAVAISLFDWYMSEYTMKGQAEAKKYPGLFKKISTIIIFLIAIIIILKELNIEISPLVASLGIAGLAVALALQDTLSNFFSGFYIISDKTIKIGDFIEIEGAGFDLKGYVQDIGWRTSQVKTMSGNVIIIPNAKLAQSITTNYYGPKKPMSVSIPLGVAYDSDLDKVERLTLEVAKKVQKSVSGADRGFEPSIRFSQFGDSNINLNVNIGVDEFEKQYFVRHEFIKALKKTYALHRVEMSYPVRTVHVRK